jgi:hypothetical protein
MMAPKETTSHDTLLRMLLVIAACFAIGSIGFLLAVLLGYGAQHTAVVPQLTAVQAKSAAMQSLSASEQNGTPTSLSTSTSTAGSASAVSPAQADTADTNAAAKLKVLEGLNAQ